MSEKKEIETEVSKFTIGFDHRDRAELYKMSDAIVCDAEVVKQKIIEYHPNQRENRIAIFPWGIDLDQFKPHERRPTRDKFFSQDNFVIVCTRDHKPIYGIKILLEAFKDLVKINNQIRLLLIGSGSLTKNYIKFVDENGLVNHVKFTGTILNSELPIYLDSSDLYVSCSFSDGTSVSLLEAMACKLPVVVSDIPSNREWIENGFNGFLFEKGNSKDLEDKIIRLVNNHKLRNAQAIENFKMASKKADWNKNFMKLEKVYKQIHVS